MFFFILCLDFKFGFQLVFGGVLVQYMVGRWCWKLREGFFFFRCCFQVYFGVFVFCIFRVSLGCQVVVVVGVRGLRFSFLQVFGNVDLFWRSRKKVRDFVGSFERVFYFGDFQVFVFCFFRKLFFKQGSVGFEWEGGFFQKSYFFCE